MFLKKVEIFSFQKLGPTPSFNDGTIVIINIGRILKPIKVMSSIIKKSVQQASVSEDNQQSQISSSRSSIKASLSSKLSVNRSKQSSIVHKSIRSSKGKPPKSISSIINGKESFIDRLQHQDEQVRIQYYDVEELPEIDKYYHHQKTSKIVQEKQKYKISQEPINSYLEKQGKTSKIRQSEYQINEDKGKLSKISMASKRGKEQPEDISKHLQDRELRVEAYQPSQESSISYLGDKSSKDLINGPDLLPQQNSFHLNSSKSLDVLKEGTKYSFKDALKCNFEGIDAHQKQLKLFEKKDFFKNVVKSPRNHSKKSIYDKATASKRSIESGERNTQNYYLNIKSKNNPKVVDSQRDNEIAEMHQRLRQLEQQKMAMQTKLALKQNEIMSLKGSSVFGSDRKIEFYQSAAFFNPFQKGKESSLKSSLARKKGQSQFEREVEVTYKDFLEKIKGGNFRKNLIKSKCLAYNGEQIQIGCLTSQYANKEGVLQFTLFFTFESVSVSELRLSIMCDSPLEVTFQPSVLTNIEPGKQRKVLAKIKVHQIPFALPDIQVKYKHAEQEEIKHIIATLPLAFNKFVETMSFHNDFKAASEPKHLKTNEFRYNSKNIPLDRLTEYLSSWSVLSSNLSEGELMLGARCCFKESKFNIILNLSQKYSSIEGWLLEGDPSIVEFLVCTLKYIFDFYNK